MAVPRWPYPRLRRFAEEYLSDVHPSGSIPIPIDEFLDKPHGIDVVPVEGIYERGREAFISRDMTRIYIDKDIMMYRVPYRYRFSLAHELAHLLLHKDLIDSAPVYDDIDGWILFLQSFDPGDLRWIENQAYGLAGLLLVPADKLEEEYLAVVKQLEDAGRDFDSLTPPTMKLITNMIGEKFQVSRFVINKRARKEDLWDWDEDLIV